MLRAVGDHHPLPGAVGAEAPEPGRTSHAVVGGAGLGLVLQHPGHVLRVLAQGRHGALQRIDFVGGDGDVVRQVDLRCRRAGAGIFGAGVEVAHIGAVAHSGTCQPLTLQVGVGTADRSCGHAEAFRHHPVGRELFTRRQLPAQDRLPEFGGNGEVAGGAAGSGWGRGRHVAPGRPWDSGVAKVR